MISVIITSFNEGDEVKKTVDSIRANTAGQYEIILVDDGSTDGSCDGHDVHVIRHQESQGIAASRRVGVAAARGDAFAFLDGHQRVSKGCLNRCAALSLERDAIVWPDVRGLVDRNWCGHGGIMKLMKGVEKDKKTRREGLYGGRYRSGKPRDVVSRCSTMIVPGYTMSRKAWDKCELIDGLKRWGASEPALTVKAFFTDTDVLHLCDGSLARHFFRPSGKIPYSAPWSLARRNHALISRVCFEDETWQKFWRGVYKKLKVTDEQLAEIEQDPLIETQRADFKKIKKRPDSEFWRGLLHEPVPAGVVR